MLLDIAGLSGGASLTIPSLLSPDLVGGSSILTSLDELNWPARTRLMAAGLSN